MRRLQHRTRNSHNEDIDSEGSWAISYGDMVTLLLAFFVLFFTTNPEQERQKDISNSLKLALSAQEKSDTALQPDDKIQVGTSEGEGIDEKVVDQLGAKVHQIGQQLVVEFPYVSFFDIGNVTMNSVGMRALEKFVKVYLPYAGSYVLGIRAYTDARRVKARNLKYRDNLELSALRSVSAMRYFRTQGIPLSRMKLGGYGELKITHDELRRIASERGVQDHQSFARKVVLVIEPEPMERGGL